MKHLILTLTVASASLTTTAADFKPIAFNGPVAAAKSTSRASSETEPNAMDFTYAGEVAGASSIGASTSDEVFMAIEIPETLANAYAGNTITAFNATTGVYSSGNQYLNHINDVIVFITDDLGAEPFYTQPGTLGPDGFTDYTIELNTPYTIEAGKKFFIGYRFHPTESPTLKREYYISCDNDGFADPASCWIGYNTLAGEQFYQSFANQIGALCMGFRVVGDNLPADGVNLRYGSGPEYVEPGIPFSYNLSVRGFGNAKAENVDVTYTIGSEEPRTINVPIGGNGIGFNEEAVITINDMVCDHEQPESHISFEITRVNGEANIARANAVSASISCFTRSKGYDRMHVIEEVTGTWCKWCPRGIVMMEYIKTNYPGMFAGIAVHDSDAMAAASCVAALEAVGIPGYPFMFIDRTVGDDPGNLKLIDNIADANYPAPMRVSQLESSTTDENTIDINASVQFAFDTDNADNRYRLAFYITENGVGPYRQLNAYAGGSEGVMGGWELKASSVSTYFDDVARMLYGEVTGFESSIPADIKAGEEYPFSINIVPTYVKGRKFTVTAFIVDNTLFSIRNAAQIEVNIPDDSSVGEIEAAATDGSEWYDLHGRRVANPGHGLYILRKGSSTSKVLL